MNKETFLKQLEQLLFDIPREEREEAVNYYRSYFEDAGVEREAVVLEELGSPQRIAADIKEGLKGPNEKNSRDSSEYLKNSLQVHGKQTERDTASSDSYNQQQAASANSYGQQSASSSAAYGRQGTSSSASYGQQGTSSSAPYGQYEDHKERKGVFSGMDRRTRWIFLVIIAVFALPVWGGIASGILGIVGAAIAVVAALGIFAVSGVVGGLVCAVVGIVKLCMMSLIEGLVVLGVGMLLIAGGGISIILFMLVCFKFLPWIINQAVSLFRRLWNWGRSMA